MRILVVDDSLTVQRAMELYLRLLGHQMLHAGNGSEGVAMAMEHLPDAIFMDVVMPSVCGYEACLRLKTHPSTRAIPVVLLAQDDLSMAPRAWPEGPLHDGILRKPFLKEHVAYIVDRMPEWRANFERRELERVAGSPGLGGSSAALRL